MDRPKNLVGGRVYDLDASDLPSKVKNYLDIA